MKNITFEYILDVITKLGSNICKNYLKPTNYVTFLEYLFVLQNPGGHCTKCTKKNSKCTICCWDDRGCVKTHLQLLLHDVDMTHTLRYERK